MGKKQYVVIGIGRFGESVAKTLYEFGNDVLAVDVDEVRVQEISDFVTHAVQIDSTDEYSLKSLGIGNFDVAIIAIGADVQASIMTTLIVKELGVKYVISKAQSEMHAKVLSKIGVDRIVYPEREMGYRIASNLDSSSIIDFIELSKEYKIMEIAIQKKWVNKTLKDLNIRSKYGMNIIAIKNGKDINISPGGNDLIKENDELIVIGEASELSRLEK